MRPDDVTEEGGWSVRATHSPEHLAGRGEVKDERSDPVSLRCLVLCQALGDPWIG